MHEIRESAEGLPLAHPVEFTTMLNALAQPRAFPFALPAQAPVSLLQTHASAVLLIADRVYKLKKPKDFGFFDYSTPLLRRHFCQQEVILNDPLAPGIYLGVAPVVILHDERFRFGPTFSPDEVPLPGALCEGGQVVDYAVVMARLPETATLESWVQTGRADQPLLAAIARVVARFHTTTRTDEHITGFGRLEIIQENWQENLVQMKPYVGRTLDDATYDHLVTYVRRFLEARPSLFAARVREGRIRDCHGDLRLQHLYILDPDHDRMPQEPRFVILDRIEFNERFRYSDVASEVAFLCMELDAAGHPELSRGFVDTYVVATGDEALRELLPFYQCYRACVRGKVLSFQLDEPEIPESQRESASQQASALFTLAARYADSPTGPVLIMVGGLMGTGKSTLAKALQQTFGWKLLSSDLLRKQLAHLDPVAPRADAYGQGIYSPAWTRRTYQALRREARNILAQGCSVLLDASFLRRTERQALAQEATRAGAAAFFVECVCPREVAVRRLAQRWQKRTEERSPFPQEASLASDGRPDLYNAQANAWNAFSPREEARHVVVRTTRPLSANVKQVVAALNKEQR